MPMMHAMESSVPSPLARKLKLKPGSRAAVIDAPPGYLEQLGPPAGTTLSTDLTGPLDWVQVFVETSGQLAAIVPRLIAALDAKPGEARQTFR
jgi:hypothetical protein